MAQASLQALPATSTNEEKGNGFGYGKKQASTADRKTVGPKSGRSEHDDAEEAEDDLSMVAKRMTMTMAEFADSDSETLNVTTLALCPSAARPLENPLKPPGPGKQGDEVASSSYVTFRACVIRKAGRASLKALPLDGGGGRGSAAKAVAPVPGTKVQKLRHSFRVTVGSARGLPDSAGLGEQPKSRFVQYTYPGKLKIGGRIWGRGSD